MTTANENPLGAESGISEYTKWDEHIRKMDLFNLLLRQQPNEEILNEDGAENTTENIYMLSTVLQRACAQGYAEEDFIRQMLDFSKSDYVALIPVPEEADAEELVQAGVYGNVQISLNEAKMLQALLDNSLSLNRAMRDLTALLQKQEAVWALYEQNKERMDRQCQEMEKWHEESGSIKTDLENTIETDKDARTQEAESLKEEVKKIAEEKVGSQLEDELRLSGKIGSAMQDMQKDIIQFMGIFIAIFALLGLNIGNAGKWSTADFFHMNLAITASMSTLLFLISVIMYGKKDSRTSCMGILTAVLWFLSAFMFFVFPYLKDNIISFWATYYKQ